MVLKTVYICLLLMTCGCATAGYERYDVFDLKKDKIYQHRASFHDVGKISMAYAVVYWDIIEEKVEKADSIVEVYYIWLRNGTSSPLLIDPNNLTLYTEKGMHISLSPLTGRTSSPLGRTEVAPQGAIGGYAAFEIAKETIEIDKPSRIIYDDQTGNRAERYLLIGDMKKYEGLELEDSPRYYAPVYPRNYWYPYYFPYDYYPFDLRFYFFYHYEPRRRHYYVIPSEPGRREFYTPSPSQERELDKPSPTDIEKKREFR